MAKSPIVDNNTRKIEGILNCEDMTIECLVNESGQTFKLSELLERFDGEDVKITIAISSKF